MKVKIELECQMAGIYRCEKFRKGDRVFDSGWFENLVLNTGLDRLGNTTETGVAAYNICRVGAGSTTPLETDSGLASQLGSTSAVSGTYGVDIAGGFYWIRCVYTFAEGAVVGNVSEIGTGWHASDPNTLFSRALVKDSMGAPTSISILADEILQVTWEHRRYWPVEDTTGTITNTGNIGGDYAWTARAAQVGSWGFVAFDAARANFAPYLTVGFNWYQPAIYYGGSLGAASGLPSGTRNTALSAAARPYVAGSYQSKMRFSLSLAQGNNAAGIGSVVMGVGNSTMRAAVQVGFTPALPKTAARAMTLDIGFSWTRKTL